MAPTTETNTAELLDIHQRLQAVYYKRANAIKQERMIARHLAAFHAEIESLEKRREELVAIELA